METPTLHRLRTFFRICFGYLTLVSLVASSFTVASLYWMAINQHRYAYTYRGQRNLLVAGALIVLSRLVLFIPVIWSTVFGFAWWTLKTGKLSARTWAIAASALTTLSSAGLAVARFVFWPSNRTHLHHHYPVFYIAFIAIGILGIVVFLRSSSESIQASAPNTRFKGDGTSAVLDLFVTILALTGVWGGIIFYTRWGRAHNLPFVRNAVSWPWILLIIFITVILHEAAHASVGLAFGMKLRAFVIGPFQWRIRDGRWTYRFVPAAILSFGGSTGIIPTNPNQSRWIEIAMIAAGPLINLLAGLATVLGVIAAKGHSWERYWQPLAFFALVNIVTFAVNLVPFRPEALYSDGARMSQLFSNGPWAELHRVFIMVSSSTITPLRPRDYNIDAIQNAAAHFTRGREALMLHLFATSHFLDRNQISEARASFAQAASIYSDNPAIIPPELLTTFVFNAVYLDRDPAAARRFWDIYASSGPTHFGVDYWLARSALHFIENRASESHEAWNTGAALASRLPAAGAYDFDRDRYRLMRDLLGSAAEPQSGHLAFIS